ncbi:MAG TPA: DUF2127 domain-containing protein [Chloroflexota bacterium]|nr:DUF2127 domain-containing protein [Chloroflexota bacterium]
MKRHSRTGRSWTGISLLAIEKTIGAVFFFAATGALLFLYARGITHPIQAVFAEELAEDPHDLVANLLLRFLPQISRQALLTLTGIAAAYFVLHVVEATGLWARRLWVEYLVLVETSALLPYEVYEIVRAITWFKLVALVLNVAIVAFLAQRRFRRGSSAEQDLRRRPRRQQ